MPAFFLISCLPAIACFCFNFVLTLFSPVLLQSKMLVLCIRFSYVSTLLVVDRLGGGKGILLSIVLIMRFIPSIFLFPIAGIFADR